MNLSLSRFVQEPDLTPLQAVDAFSLEETPNPARIVPLSFYELIDGVVSPGWDVISIDSESSELI